MIENGLITGVVPVPALINQPGPISRMLERLMWATGTLLLRARYGRSSPTASPRPRQPPDSPL